MDLKKLSSDGKTSLLTLPRSDFKASSSDDESTASSHPELLLVQLPPGWSVKDLTNSHFVAKLQHQAALVCNSKQKSSSFYVSSVETSNCLVLVPPLISNNDTDTMVGDSNDDDDDADSASSKGSPAKKTKWSLRTVPARLLNQAQGASFLELLPKPLRLADLRRALECNNMLEYNQVVTTNTGRSVTHLAHELQQAHDEIRQGLERLMPGAYPLDNNNDRFVLLSDEILLHVHFAIISSLTEADDCHDYAQRGVNVPDLVQKTVDAMSEEERFEHVQGVVRHCLMRLAASSRHKEGSLLKLSFKKVAQWVARRLFSLQTAPWEESLFLTRWQSEVPGVGDAYQVSTDMLQGLAIHHRQGDNSSNSSMDDERYWMYLPADQIMHTNQPNDDKSETLDEQRTSKAFDRLFAWKTSWLLSELLPYLDAMVDATAASQADLLLQYTRVTTQDIHGVPVKLYHKR